MEANIPSVNRKKNVRRRNRKVIVRMMLLQLVMLAIASHYARAKLYGIMKYYLLELSVMFCLMCVIVYINDSIQKRKKLQSNSRLKKPLQCCPVDEVEHIKDGSKIYNYNWIIKDESKVDVKEEDKKEECQKKEENPKQIYRSPFDKAVNTDKKVLYKSPFDGIGSRRVMIVLDSARDDDKYILSRDARYCGRFCHAVRDKYVLSRDARYCGKFCHAVRDKYVLSRDARYCGKFCHMARDRYILVEDIPISKPYGEQTNQR